MSSVEVNGTAIVPTIPPNAMGTALGVTPEANMVATLGITWASLALDTLEAESLMLASVGETSLDTDDVLQRELHVVAWMVRHQSWSDKTTGEVREGPTVYLLTSEGDTYRSSSKGILEGLAVIAARRPAGAYDPPIVVVIKRVKTAAGLPRHILVRAPSPIDPVRVKGVKNVK